MARPLLVAAGYVVLGFGTRYMHNDIDCFHEAYTRGWRHEDRRGWLSALGRAC